MHSFKTISVLNIFSNKALKSNLKKIVIITSSFNNETCSGTEGDIQSVKISNEKIVSCPEEPTTCCMSGCANCVWIAYAEELCKYFIDGEEKVKKQIMEKVTDPSMRAFLMTELKNLNK